MKPHAKKWLGLMLAAAAIAPQLAQAQTKILFNAFIQRQATINKDVIIPWLADLTRATQGRVVFEVPATSLNAPQQQYDGVTKGIYDAAYMFNGFLADRIKLVQVAQLPFGSTNPAANSVALWKTYEKYFAKADEFKDVHVLSLFVLPAGELYSLGEPLRSLSDVKGKKIFAIPGPASQILGAAGAAVVSAPAVRSYEVISGGTVDAFAGYNATEAEAFKTLQFAKSVTDVPGYLNAPSFSMFINKKKWATISPEDQATITKMSGEAFARRMKAYDADMTKSRQAADQLGIKRVAASSAFISDLQKLSQGIDDAYVASANTLGVDGRAALDYYRNESRH